MASDGLTGVVPDKDLMHILGTVDDPQRAAVMLKDLALANDSKDNVTCLIIHRRRARGLWLRRPPEGRQPGAEPREPGAARARGGRSSDASRRLSRRRRRDVGGRCSRWTTSSRMSPRRDWLRLRCWPGSAARSRPSPRVRRRCGWRAG